MGPIRFYSRRTGSVVLFLLMVLTTWVLYPTLTAPGQTKRTRISPGRLSFSDVRSDDRLEVPVDVHDFHDPALPTTRVDRSQRLYHLFEDRPGEFDLRPLLMDVPILRGQCLDSWLTHGVLPSGCHSVRGSPSSSNDNTTSHDPLRISFVHTYLNGSDPLWQTNKRAYSTFTQIGRTQAVPDRHYRDHGELRASLRARASAFAHLDEERRARVDGFVVLADWGMRADGQDEELSTRKSNQLDTPVRRLGAMDERARIGQVPAWFDIDREGAYVGGSHGMGPNATDLRRSGIKMVWHSQMWSSFSLSAPTNLSDESAPSYRKLASARFGKGLTIIQPEGRAMRSDRRQALLRDGLPTFNSFSIESMLWNTPGIAEQYVYMNDDFFLLSPHNPTDFHTPSSIYGPIIPFIFAEANYTHPAKPKWPPKPPRDSLGWFSSGKPYQDQSRPPSGGFVNYPVTSALSCNHEWSSLTRANRMLGLRFGLRQRPGHMHIPKPVLGPMMHEAGLIWGSDFARSTRRRFREDARSRPGDINAMFVSEMLLVERAREAMLWTWIVARLGEEADVPGRLGHKANREIRRVLGVPEPTRMPWFGLLGGDDMREVIISRTDLHNRHTLGRERVHEALHRLGEGPPLVTEYGFSSLDGPLAPFGATVYNCSIVLYSCFGTWWTRAHASDGVTVDAARLFKRIAFERPHCGDCLLSGVIQASGTTGMREILPASHLEVPVTGDGDDELEQPHLPFASAWSDADFSIEGVFAHGSWRGDVNLRQWCERLIARYTWTAAVNSTAIFRMLNGDKSIDDAFQAMGVDNGSGPSCAVLNDDIPTPLRGGAAADAAQKMSDRVTAWLTSKWEDPGFWERKGL